MKVWDADVQTLANTLAARLSHFDAESESGEDVYWYGPRTLKPQEAIRDVIPGSLRETLSVLRGPLDDYCGPRLPQETLSQEA